MAEVATPPPAAPQSDADYRALAMQPPPAEPAKTEVKTEGEPKPEVKGEVKPEVKPEVKEPEPLARSFEVLAKEKTALRAQEAQLKSREAVLTKAERMLQAIDAKDPMAFLAAGGFRWAEVVDKALGEEAAAGKETKEVKPAAKRGEDDPLVKELNEIKAKLKSREDAEHKQTMNEVITRLASEAGDKFKLTRAKKMETQATEYVQSWFKAQGELPVPGDLKASMLLALEAIEQHLTKEADFWKGVLTPPANADTTKNAEPKSVGAQAASEQASRTLTNSHSASPVGTPRTPTPRTDEDYQALALEMLKKGG